MARAGAHLLPRRARNRVEIAPQASHSPPLGGAEALPKQRDPGAARRRSRAHARARRAGLRADLNRVHDPLMSPLVWDLGHIAAFEDLWLAPARRRARAAAPRARRRLRRRRDARAPIAASCPTCAATRRSPTWTRCASGRSACSTTPTTTALLWDMVIQHEQQHNETMLQTLQLAEPGVYAPQRRAQRVPRAAASAPPDTAAGVLVEAGLHARRRRRRLRLRQRAPAHTSSSCRRSASTRAPVGCGAYADFIADGGYARPRAVVAGRLGAARARGLAAPALLGRATAACAASSAASGRRPSSR